MRVSTIGHGTRTADEFVATLDEASVETLVDVRRFPGSRRNPQFSQAALAAELQSAGIAYLHAPDLGGRRSGVPGEHRFGCLRVPAFRSYAAWMSSSEWQQAIADALGRENPASCAPRRCRGAVTDDSSPICSRHGTSRSSTCLDRVPVSSNGRSPTRRFATVGSTSVGRSSLSGSGAATPFRLRAVESVCEASASKASSWSARPPR
jgi:uncharacterized protein DUF488